MFHHYDNDYDGIDSLIAMSYCGSHFDDGRNTVSCLLRRRGNEQ